MAYGAYGYVNLGSLGSSAPAPPVLPPVPSNAHPMFKPELDRLLARISELGLPLKMKQLCRTKEFQCWAYFNDGSKIKDPSKGAHVSCMAMDFTIDTSKSGSPYLVDAKRNSKGVINEWDTGLDKDSKGVFNIVARPKVYSLWQLLGSIIAAEFPKLRWGGSWTNNTHPYLGWDPYHVELKGYTNYIADDVKSQTWECAPPSNPRLVTDAVKAAAIKAENLAEEARDRPFEFAGYGIGTLLAVGGTVAGAYYVYKRLRRR